MANIKKKETQPEATQFTAEEYKELLLQAVTVIESARCRLARQAAATTNDAYWQIGKLLYDRKLLEVYTRGCGHGCVKKEKRAGRAFRGDLSEEAISTDIPSRKIKNERKMKKIGKKFAQVKNFY